MHVPMFNTLGVVHALDLSLIRRSSELSVFTRNPDSDLDFPFTCFIGLIGLICFRSMIGGSQLFAFY